MKRYFALLISIGAHVLHFSACRPHSSKDARQTTPAIRLSRSPRIPDKERVFVAERNKDKKQALESFLNRSIHPAYLPRIAICSSGGGFETMCATTGLLASLDKAGLLPAVSYIAGTSGASWALLPWVAEHGSIQEYASGLTSRLERGISHSFLPVSIDISHRRREKSISNRLFNATDIFGITLGHTLLKPFDPHHNEITLSGLAPLLDPTKHPYPLNAAAARLDETNYHYIELTPHAIRMSGKNISLAPNGLNRSYFNGLSQTHTAEPPLSYIMAILGSAYSIMPQKLVDTGPDFIKKVLPSGLVELIQNNSWGQRHMSPAVLPNITYGIPHALGSENEEMILLDAAYKNNLPLALFAEKERLQDMILICDTEREQSKQSATLQKALELYQGRGFPIPNISENEYHTLGNQPVQIFNSPEKDAPTLIYISLNNISKTMPPGKDQFTYSPASISRGFRYIDTVITEHKKEISDALVKAILKKRDHTTWGTWALRTLRSFFP